MTILSRASIVTLVGSVTLFIASTASAEGEACYNDIDCPGTACGDSVCNWEKLSPMPHEQKIFYCNPAGTQPMGRDGWCTTDADCKCKDQGAKCVAPYCTFTKPMTGSTGGASSTGGAATTSGGATTTSGGATTTSGGASSTGGTPTSTGGAASSTGGTATTPAAADDGGCSVKAPGRSASGAALGVGLLALGLAFARRRRH